MAKELVDGSLVQSKTNQTAEFQGDQEREERITVLQHLRCRRRHACERIQEEESRFAPIPSGYKRGCLCKVQMQELHQIQQEGKRRSDCGGEAVSRYCCRPRCSQMIR